MIVTNAPPRPAPRSIRVRQGTPEVILRRRGRYRDHKRGQVRRPADGLRKVPDHDPADRCPPSSRAGATPAAGGAMGESTGTPGSSPESGPEQPSRHSDPPPGRLPAVSRFGAAPEQFVDRASGALLTGRHQVRIHPEREPRIVVTEVLRQRFDVLPAVEKRRGVEVPQRVHAGRWRPLDAGNRQRRMPALLVERVSG